MTSTKFYAIIAGVGSGTGTFYYLPSPLSPLTTPLTNSTGRALALKFAQSYPVILLSRHAISYSSIVAEITQSGGSALGVSVDVADRADVLRAFAQIKAYAEGDDDRRLAAAVYNVGGGFVRKPFLELTPEEFDAGLDSNA